MKSYYEILGVSENASQSEIKEKYRSHAMKMHPDKLIDRPEREVEEIQKKFQEITNAYQTLSDENERRNYDYQRKSSGSFDFGGGRQSGFGGVDLDFEDIFENFFGGNRSSRNWSSSRRSESSSRKAENLEALLTISFKDLVIGSVKKFSLNMTRACVSCSQTGAFSSEDIKNCSACSGRGYVDSVRRTFLGSMKTQIECSSCKGSGKIIARKCTVCKGLKMIQSKEEFELKIPRGIKPGQRINLKSKGNDEVGKARGDLIIEIDLKQHAFFQRKENEIHCSVPISFFDAILGNKIKVLTIEGIQEITVPKYCQFGDCTVLKSKGFYVGINSDKRGDFYVWFQIKLPKRIGSETEYLIKKIYEQSSWNPNEEFIKKMEAS